MTVSDHCLGGILIEVTSFWLSFLVFFSRKHKILVYVCVA